jgi:hypothetical protein
VVVHGVGEGGDGVRRRERDRAGRVKHQHDGEEGVEGREDPGDAAQVKAAQRDGPGLGHLGEQQRGDEVAGDDEEDPDPEVADVEPAVVADREVGDHHHADRDGAQPVQRGMRAEAVLMGTPPPPARLAPLAALTRGIRARIPARVR